MVQPVRVNQLEVPIFAAQHFLGARVIPAAGKGDGDVLQRQIGFTFCIQALFDLRARFIHRQGKKLGEGVIQFPAELVVAVNGGAVPFDGALHRVGHAIGERHNLTLYLREPCLMFRGALKIVHKTVHAKGRDPDRGHGNDQRGPH